ncbi:MAG: GlsB/YeaQ/YmgE family stress response membrane protein [Planctomycetaceae bacterium]
MSLGKFITWLIVGGLAGTLAGRTVTFRKEGLGRLANLGIGMVGALIGGGIFQFFHINLGLGDLKVTFEDLIAAFSGSLLFVFALWLIRKLSARKQPANG